MPATLVRALGYRFKDASLLQRALTHRSHSVPHNERLEFLGDGVLNFVVAALLHARFPTMDEGDLSRLRANLVNQAALADIALSLDLSSRLRLGEGELRSGGARRPSILADALEALFGAIYLDGGFDAAFKVIEGQYEGLLARIDPRETGKDAKTRLQEMLQARHLELPAYRVLGVQGAAHEQRFEVECRVAEFDVVVTAGGHSRRAAEQAAAEQAVKALLALPQWCKGRPARIPRSRRESTTVQDKS